MLRTVRSKITLLAVAALVLSLGISLPLEVLAGRRNSQVVAQREFVADITELAPAIGALQGQPEAGRLLSVLFRRLARSEELYILDSTGAVLTSTVPGIEGRPLREIARTLPQDSTNLLAQGGPSVIRSVPARGGIATEVFAPLGGGNTLLAVLPPQASGALQHALLYHTVPPLLLGVLLLAGLLWLGLNRLVMKPLGLLAASSRNVASGDDEAAGMIPSELIPGDDVGEVLVLRNRMLQRLWEGRRRLEDQLNQRTFELEVTHRVSGQIGHYGTDQELLKEVLMRLNPVVSWDAVGGFLVEAGRARVWAQGRGRVTPEVAARIGGWLEEACRTGGCDHLPVLRSLWETTTWSVVGPTGPTVDAVGSHLSFPLQVAEGFAGAVVLCSVQPNAYAGHHQRIIRDVLEQGLGAVGRVRRLVAVQARELESVLHGMNLGVAILDEHGEITYINRMGMQRLARLEKPGKLAAAQWKRSEVLSSLLAAPGFDGSPDGASRAVVLGPLRITLAPFTGNPDSAPGGSLVLIEETSRSS
jgi:PAS domain-containing protein